MVAWLPASSLPFPGFPSLPIYFGERQKCANDLAFLLVFQSKEDLSLWTCTFHPPLQLFFVIRNTRQLHDFGLSKIKVWNYWAADGVSNRLIPRWASD